MVVDLTDQEIDLIKTWFTQCNATGLDNMRVVVGLANKIEGEKLNGDKTDNTAHEDTVGE